jgi:hypothetical protein
MKGRLVWITGFYLRKADYAAGLRKRYIPEHKSLLYIDLCAFVIDEPASSHPLDNFPVIRKTNSHEEVKSAAKIPPPPTPKIELRLGRMYLASHLR